MHRNNHKTIEKNSNTYEQEYIELKGQYSSRISIRRSDLVSFVLRSNSRVVPES